MGHEAHAVRQPEQATLASHGLADQKRLGVRVVHTGRVELHELHVGHPVACPPCRCHAVARGAVEVARVQVHLAGTARNQDCAGCLQGHDLVFRRIQCVESQARRIRDPELAPGDQVDQGVVLEQRDVGIAAYRLEQRLLNGRTVRCNSPYSSEKGTPSSRSQTMACGACSTTKRVAARLHSPAPATNVSSTWDWTLSVPESTAAMPPCAQELEPLFKAPLVINAFRGERPRQ